MNQWSLWGDYGRKTDVHVSVKPDDKKPTITIIGDEFVSALESKVSTYFEILLRERVKNTAEREDELARLKSAHDEIVERDKKEAESMRTSLKSLADTFERAGTFWVRSVDEAEAMEKAKEVMAKRDPRFFGKLASLEDVIWRERPYALRAGPFGPYEDPCFTEAKKFLDTAKQFRGVSLEVPVWVISGVVGWKPEEISA